MPFEIIYWTVVRLGPEWLIQSLYLTVCLSTLGGMALWAAAVATRVVGEQLGAALVAPPDLATECRGATVEDVFDGAPV